MIDFENYERATRRNEHSHGILKDVDMGDLYSNLSKIEQITVEYALDRLAELEDLIEKGKLVPKYCIVNDYVGYHLCALQKNVRVLYIYEKKQTAEKKLKELMESDEDE